MVSYEAEKVCKFKTGFKQYFSIEIVKATKGKVMCLLGVGFTVKER